MANNRVNRFSNYFGALMLGDNKIIEFLSIIVT